MLDQETKLNLRGYSIIDGQSREGNGAAFRGVDPAKGEQLEPVYHCASIADLNRAADLAEDAFAAFRKLSGRERGRFLRHIAQGVEEGSWVTARIDPAQPDRKPLPRSDIRSMMRGLGPVAVFGASNFPLAFSVAGGDTAAAFAAGNPVIVKAHHAHPGTSEMVGQVIARSARECGLPAGVFALLFGAGSEIGATLVDHPNVKAVGFTGSLTAGKALMERAAARPGPIPCFREMSSVNPVFVLPEALSTRGEKIAGGLFGSFTLGVGQFCTKPGLVFLPRSADANELVDELKKHVEKAAEAPMLTEGISKSYRKGVAGRQKHQGGER